MLSDLPGVLHAVAVEAWALRWVFAAAAAMASAAVAIAKHVEQDRRAIAALNAERGRAARAEQRLAILQHATGALAVTVARQDTPADWISAQRDGSSR